MSEGTPDHDITDDELPEDLDPEQSPLAEGLPEPETVEGLLEEGKLADEMDETDDTAEDDGES